MQVNLEMLRNTFRDVLSGQMTREAADRWAYSLIKEAELGRLDFLPPGERDRIWDGLMYLYGIDMKCAPSEYLHSDIEIKSAMVDKIGE